MLVYIDPRSLSGRSVVASHEPIVAACENSNLMQATGRVAKGVSLRFGYAADRWLFYVKGGGAWASDSYSVPGAFTGVPFDFEGLDLRFGWTVGGGVEWAFSDLWSARLEYDYYQFGNGSVLMSDSTNVLSGPVNVRQSVQIVKAGLNFHVWWGQ